ncbi:MAG: inositol-3-phosphate synthase, partial [Actinomycetota bacterium]
GLDVADAIWIEPNNTTKFSDVPSTGVRIARGHTYDGLGKYYRDIVTESELPPVDVAKLLRDTGTDVLVNYLPVGSERAARFYAQQALEAGVAFVNCMPVFIATNEDWAQRFTRHNIPIIGDDIKSQLGATISHRVLSKLFEDRGVIIDHTYQLNFGGNMDFKNMLETERLQSKKISKTQSVTSQITGGIDSDDIHIGPSDHVPWLKDRKWAYIRIEGREFGDVPINMELKLEVWDSPNSAGVVIDAVRCAKVALDRGIGGPLIGPSAYFMKSPPVQYPDGAARDMVEAFIAGDDVDLERTISGNGHVGNGFAADAEAALRPRH